MPGKLVVTVEPGPTVKTTFDGCMIEVNVKLCAGAVTVVPGMVDMSVVTCAGSMTTTVEGWQTEDFEQCEVDLWQDGFDEQCFTEVTSEEVGCDGAGRVEVNGNGVVDLLHDFFDQHGSLFSWPE